MQNSGAPKRDEELIADLRRQFKAGKTAIELVREIQNRVGVHDSLFMPIVYLRHAFHIGIGDAKSLGAWTDFHGNDTDEQINEFLTSCIVNKQAEWDK